LNLIQNLAGIVLLHDKKPEEPEKLVISRLEEKIKALKTPSQTAPSVTNSSL
jgi:hypothetical protein